ncbi:MAG: S9 family peptidase [Ferruginibacter sp.]|nr:S9 family peptidase [Cytophagales bacterium]
MKKTLRPESRIALALLLLAGGLPLAAQPVAKKPLDHAAYDGWKSVTDSRLSNDGKWAAYQVSPQEGDAELVITDLASLTSRRVPRGADAKLSEDSRYAVFLIKPPFSDTRQAKIKKKKKEDLPKDSLGIVGLAGGELVKIPRVKSFKMPGKGSGFVAYHLDKPLPPPDTSKTRKTPRTNQAVKDADEDPEKEKSREEGTTMVLRNLPNGTELRFNHVTEYAFSRNGRSLVFVTVEKPKDTLAVDTTAVSGIFLYDTQTASLKTLLRGKGKYRQPTPDESGTQAAFVADRDTSRSKQRFYQLYYWNARQDSAARLADTNTVGMPARWAVSEHGKLFFSGNGKRLFFGTAPVQPPPDTTLVEFEVASVDVWNWQDGHLQPQQLKNRENDLKKNFLAVIVPAAKERRLVQLATAEVPVVTLTDENNGDLALGLSDLPYRRQSSWEGYPARQDGYVVNVATGTRKKVLENLRAEVGVSPRGNYLFWYDGKERAWFTHAPKTGQTRNLTAPVKANFHDELNDLPDDPSPYGFAGWTEDDRQFIAYDRHDLWGLDPQGRGVAVNLTGGAGRAGNLSFRYLLTDPEEKFIRAGATLPLHTFHLGNKKSGYAAIQLGKNIPPRQFMLEDFEYTHNLRKAKNADAFLFTKSSFAVCPDLYTAGTDFASIRPLTDLNPQQKEYNWGTVELVNWHSAEGKPLEGLLYKPENFDPGKKYPMIVYFYDRSSDGLHHYFPPAPSASTINRPFFVSRGYLVFVPDITYLTGYPGQSAENAIVPGVLKLLERPYVDRSNLALNGQSWGGYQVAYLITRTNLFKAAMAGAPVANMTSAYGGIRWETGISRMFQYEKSQSRIGGTLWEKPMLYLENSPLFRADFVQTPLLMMHNDADGAVPWYQGIELFTALRRLNKPVWMLTYNKEAHNLVERRNRKDLSIRQAQFYDHFLKGEPMPAWMKSGVPAVDKGKRWGYELIEEKPAPLTGK